MDWGSLHFVAWCAIGCIAVLAFLAWAREPSCPECAHCGRVKHKKEQEQKARKHDEDHRFYGYCSDKRCVRNPRPDTRPPDEPPTP